MLCCANLGLRNVCIAPTTDVLALRRSTCVNLQWLAQASDAVQASEPAASCAPCTGSPGFYFVPLPSASSGKVVSACSCTVFLFQTRIESELHQNLLLKVSHFRKRPSNRLKNRVDVYLSFARLKALMYFYFCCWQNVKYNRAYPSILQAPWQDLDSVEIIKSIITQIYNMVEAIIGFMSAS